MKFSVLLPTRNRLEYLKYAITTVLLQDYDNWEIIISDNDSEEDIRGYISTLKDSRIKYFRTSSFLPVTDNWNNALKHSTGDYIIMLGDDDCLLKGFFQKSLKCIKEFDQPDIIYSSALQYAYPKVLPDHPEGLLHVWGNACFLENKEHPFILGKNEAVRLAKETLKFRVMFNFNMQFSLVSRKMIDELRKYGEFFQSPYPDYYATTALFLKSKTIVAVPQPLVAIGITPKSFGYYYFNDKEDSGVAFLKNIPEQETVNRIKKFILPGTDMNSSWLLAMETVKQNFGKEFALKVLYNRYRFLQVLHYFKKRAIEKKFSLKELKGLKKHLSFWEKIKFYVPLLCLAQMIRQIPNKQRRMSLTHRLSIHFSHPPYTMKQIHKKFKNILDVFENEEILK